MKKLALLLFVLGTTSLSAASTAFVGAHHNYTSLRFNNPSRLEGYMTGVKAYYGAGWCWLASDITFEGYWNIVPLTGDPCQKSNVTEYFAEWSVGPSFDLFKCIYFYLSTGFGWNYLENDQDPGADVMTWEYTRLFVPIGLSATWCMPGGVSATLHGEYRPDVYARLKTMGLELKNKKEDAFRIGLPIAWHKPWGCNVYHLILAPYYDWSRFGAFPDDTMDIPSLTRWNAGLRIALGMTF